MITRAQAPGLPPRPIRGGHRFPRSGAAAEPTSASTPRRLPALDGLRGLAALVVVVHHVLLVSPVLAAPYLVSGTRPQDAGLGARLLLYTPVHLIWAGTEAVYVFFVLSGFVLTLPYLAGRTAGWPSYYAQRLTRLYLPIVAAVAVAFALLQVGDRAPAAFRSSWMGLHPASVGLRALAHDVTVVRGAGATNSALWSLQWEVLFSLLLPVFLLVVVRLRLAAAVQAAAVAGALVVGQHFGHPALFYLSIFAAGVVLATRLPRLRAAGERFDRLRRPVRLSILLAALVLLILRWPLTGAGLVTGASALPVVAGACLLVAVFAVTGLGQHIGTWPPIAWLGRRSFSLYLVHEPIVVKIAFLLGRHASVPLVLALGLPLSLGAAETFFRLVERPSHRLSRRAGAWVAAQRLPRRPAVRPIGPTRDATHPGKPMDRTGDAAT